MVAFGNGIQKLMLQSNVYFGCGAANTLPRSLAAFGFDRIGIIADENVADLSPALNLGRKLLEGGCHIVRSYRSRSSQEPTYDYLDEAAEIFRADSLDVLIGIGGGSTLDLTKGVGILLKNPGRGIDYRGMDKVSVPGVPVALVPTTAGTGSEATGTASFIDLATYTKLGINGRYVNCLAAVLDPEFVVTCPPMPTVAAGLDALVHACEAVTCKTANALSVLLGCEAVRLILEALPKAVAEPGDLANRAETLFASYLAGLAMWNAGGGPASGISYPLGVHYSVPHGLAGGVLLPHVVAFNVASGYWGAYAAIYDRLHVAEKRSGSEKEKAEHFCARMFELYERIGALKLFTRYGVTRANIPEITRLTLEQRKANLDLNPVPFEEKDVVALLEKVVD